jgi:poly-gamma-glutamate synthesis protein (capsule biosynthesis protein)
MGQQPVVPTKPPAVVVQPTAVPTQAARPQQQVANLPVGMALVTSPRLPMFGIASKDIAALMRGDVADWRQVGCPVAIDVVVAAIAGSEPDGARPTESFTTYEDLAAAMLKDARLVAMVPVDQVDWRVSSLTVDGYDPVRDRDGIIRIAFVGDIVPGRNVDEKMRYYGDFTRPFKLIANELKSYDICVGNLEGNLSSTITPPTNNHTFSFVSDPQMIEGMQMAGIDALSLANNHTAWNNEGWGLSGFLDTISAFEAYGMPFFGGGRDLVEARTPWVWERSGFRVAIIGVDGVTANLEQTKGVLSDYVGAEPGNPGTYPYDTNMFTSDIAAMASSYDIVLPYFHMGIEYQSNPPAWSVVGAQNAIDAGATMVVTNHPHIIQGMQTYNRTPIVYSVGNFVFDQMFSYDVRTGSILELVFQGRNIVGLRSKGIEVEDFHMPRLMTDGEQAAMMEQFWQKTDALADE